MIRFKLKEMMKKRGIKTLAELIRESKRFHHGKGVRRDALMRMRDGTFKWLDLNLLDSLCSILKCRVGELIEFVPEKKKT